MEFINQLIDYPIVSALEYVPYDMRQLTWAQLFETNDVVS